MENHQIKHNSNISKGWTTVCFVKPSLQATHQKQHQPNVEQQVDLNNFLFMRVHFHIKAIFPFNALLLKSDYFTRQKTCNKNQFSPPKRESLKESQRDTDKIISLISFSIMQTDTLSLSQSRFARKPLSSRNPAAIPSVCLCLRASCSWCLRFNSIIYALLGLLVGMKRKSFHLLLRSLLFLIMRLPCLWADWTVFLIPCASIISMIFFLLKEIFALGSSLDQFIAVTTSSRTCCIRSSQPYWRRVESELFQTSITQHEFQMTNSIKLYLR